MLSTVSRFNLSILVFRKPLASGHQSSLRCAKNMPTSCGSLGSMWLACVEARAAFSKPLLDLLCHSPRIQPTRLSTPRRSSSDRITYSAPSQSSLSRSTCGIPKAVSASQSSAVVIAGTSTPKSPGRSSRSAHRLGTYSPTRLWETDDDKSVVPDVSVTAALMSCGRSLGICDVFFSSNAKLSGCGSTATIFAAGQY